MSKGEIHNEGKPLPATPDLETPQKGGWNTAGAIAKVVIPPILTFVLGIVGALWIANRNARIRAIDYYITPTSGLLHKPELAAGDVKLFIGNRPIGNLSTVNIKLVNSSDTDWKDLPIEVQFARKDGSEPQLIQMRTYGSPASYPLVPQTQPHSPTDNNLRLAYTLRIANHGSAPIFTADYVFAGEEAPDVTVAVIEKGVESRRVDVGAVHNGWVWSDSFGVAAGVAAVTGLAVTLLDGIVYTVFRRSRIRHRKPRS